MEWLDVIWIDGPHGNVEHLAANGVMPSEAEWVLMNPVEHFPSASSGRPAVSGFTAAGRRLVVVFAPIDPVTVYPITALNHKGIDRCRRFDVPTRRCPPSAYAH